MSFINNIEIKNYKSIRHQKIDGCKRINVFVGPPNVGKSNILEALSLFSLPESSSSLFTDFVRIGKNTTIFFNGEIETPAQVIINDYHRVKVGYQKNILSAKFQTARFNEKFDFIENNYFNASSSIDKRKENRLIEGGILEVDSSTKDFRRNGHYFKNLRIYKGNQEDKLTDEDYIDVPILKYKFKENFDSISNYGSRLSVPFGHNIFDVISVKEQLREIIINLLKNYELDFLFDSESQEYKILKRLGNKIFTVPYLMLADTLQRLFFYQAAIYSNKNSVLLLEEPEANCYEPYIMEITNAIKNDKNDNQFFIVTHSQYVIDELMRDEESRNDTNIYLVGLDDNETKVKLLSAEASKDAYQTGLNLFFNYQTLWDEN